MLSDDRLQQLLRDANAVEAFERAVHGAGRVAPSVGARRRLQLAVSVLAAVVVLAVGLFLLNSATPRNPTEKSGTNQAKAPVANEKASLLMAVYQNDRGSLSCVNWSADALKGRNVSKLSADELTRLGLTLSCDPAAARVLVVGIEGPVAALPTSDDRARVVAQCLSASTPCSAGTFNPQTCASAGCLSQEVTVRIETLALK